MRSYKNDPQNNRGNNRANDACGLNDGVSRSFGPGKKARGMENSRRATEGNLHWLDDASVDGLKWFIQERESIRLRKEAGEARPWTDDEVLHKTKFTNIYRQHDKVSKFIFDSLRGWNGEELVFNLLIARLINRIDVLDRVFPLCSWQESLLETVLEGEGVVMNPAAYQVSPGMVKISNYETCRETIVYHTKTVYQNVYQAIGSTSDIAEAVELGNKAFGGHIKFVMLQVVLDFHYLTGYYDDDSNIPIGQGGLVIINKLGGLDKLSTELLMKKYDVEHACCEYRKYLYRQDKILSRYSYVPNSMGLESKNSEDS